MDDAFACRDGGWTQDRRRSIAQELSLVSESDDGQQQVAALFVSAVHLIKVTTTPALLLYYIRTHTTFATSTPSPQLA